ncbi:phosphopentomutase, partial [Anaeroglobus sp. AF13-6AC]|uniref:phosphopentomutase n=1 Tax=Anaeroglobus sp. AF13-6AC TaxID=2997918 RepID=UPI0022E89DBB
MREISNGKDTTSGHWEFMGNSVENPFPVFYDAFPQDLLDTFTKKTGHGWLGNEVASGTEIIARLGWEKATHIHPEGVKIVGSYGRMREISNGKDTTSGHWEFMGNSVENPFPVFYDAFPQDLLDTFTKKTGHGWLGNEVASGTEIIARLGPEHLKTKKPIVYTSADSVFQIAAHTDVIPLEELYRICKVTRKEVCVGPYEVGRVIARPFVGEPGNFVRTGDRQDYSRLPERKMVFSYLKEKGYEVIGVGKIGDIYAHIDLTESHHTANNREDMDFLIRELKRHRDKEGLLMVNFVDFDSMYGHRRNAQGYAKCLEDFDSMLGELLPLLQDDELVMITSDHGNDPTMSGTDHT